MLESMNFYYYVFVFVYYTTCIVIMDYAILIDFASGSFYNK